MPEGSLVTPPSFLKQAIKAVPAVKYALGVGGVIAVIAIVRSGFNIDLRVALFGAVIMFALMTVLVVFANLASERKSSFHIPALVFTWFSLLLVMATAAALFLSVFGGWPIDLRSLVAISRPILPGELKPTIPSISTPSSEHASVPPSAAPPVSTPQPRDPSPSNSASSGHLSPKQTADNEQSSKEHEEVGDSEALLAIRKELAGRGLDPDPFQEPRLLILNLAKTWDDARKEWNDALSNARLSTTKLRLHAKINGSSGITCSYKKANKAQCVINQTQENIYLYHDGTSFKVPIYQP